MINSGSEELKLSGLFLTSYSFESSNGSNLLSLLGVTAAASHTCM